ncbi:MAG: arginine--tRNA ligase [Hyphomicrobiales bacterium]|jgi:arginyl-tRNA synthetase
MMSKTYDLFADFRARVLDALDRSGVLDGVDRDGLPLAAITVEPPRDETHGDLSTNAAMVLAKPLKSNPRAIAISLADALGADADIISVDVAGPGFINLHLAPVFWQSVLTKILSEGEDYGRNVLGTPDDLPKTNVEYVSANPTGPMHVGHCRGAVVGDALAAIVEAAGYPVTREYYINDAGGQVDTLARSAFLRYREALGQDVGAIPEGLYPGDYLIPVGTKLANTYGEKLLAMEEAEWLPIAREASIEAMMDLIREDLASLNVHHNVFFSEASLQNGNEGDRVAQAIKELKSRGLVYEGRLEKPKGESTEEWEDREQTLFRSSQFGDDTDRALLKSDGSYTYFASDIAYHYDKYLRGYTNQINIFGADHGGYVKRMKAAVTAMSDGKASLDIRLCQLVKLYRAGEPVTMSKRSGNFVTLREVVDEVGADATRFMMLYRKNDAPLDFDFQKVTEQSKDNPVFYVQYAHARCSSVLRLAASELPDEDFGPLALKSADLSFLNDNSELGLVRLMASWPRTLAAAATHSEPHRIAFYLHDLASALHSHWNLGKGEPNLRFVNHDNPLLTRARMALVTGLAQTLRQGLTLLGVGAPDEMR